MKRSPSPVGRGVAGQGASVPLGDLAVGDIGLAGHRQIGDAADGRAALDEPDRDAPGREPGDEGRRAVDRVERERVLGVGRAGRPELLAEDADAREERRHARRQELLDGAVGRGHERLVGLALGGDVPEEAPRELAGLDDGRQQRLHGGTGHAGTIA